MSDAPASCDFAVVTHAAIDLGLVVQASVLLPMELGPGVLLGIEAYGRRVSGEAVFVYRFQPSANSERLLERMSAEAGKLDGRLLDLGKPGEDRDGLINKLATFDVQPEPSQEVGAAIQAFRERMGVGAMPQAPAVSMSFATQEELLEAYARYVADGSLFIATPRRMLEGAQLRLLLIAPGADLLEASARVVQVVERGQRGVHATLEPGQALKDFLRRKAHRHREGRAAAPASGQRHAERFDTCLEVRFTNYPELLVEFASNISRGGIFAKTYTPPPMGARVTLKVTLPDGVQVETEAAVVHVIGVEEALSRSLFPGAGLSFGTPNAEFDGRIAALLDQYRARRPRILVVDDDALFRAVLADALTEAGMEPLLAADGEQALQHLGKGLFTLDLVLLDLMMPKLDGESLLWRMRSLGSEADLKVLVLSGKSQEELAKLLGPGGANQVLGKETPMAEVLAEVRRLLHR